MGSELSCSLTPPVCVSNDNLAVSIQNPPACQQGKTRQAIVAGPTMSLGAQCPEDQTSIKSCCK